MSSSLHTAYQQRVASGFTSDDAQLRVLSALDSLQQELLAGKKGLSGLLKASKAAKGIYIWGSVGRGKSMLMDLFFMSTDIAKKKRIHFHAFMLDVHARVHKIRQKKGEENPVEVAAKNIAKDTRLLCLDEFQVSDVADAMILERLFTTLIHEGVTVVFTSNRPPEDLYQGGLQRDTFLRFVKLLREHVEVLELDSPSDYRLKQICALEKVYITPLGKKSDDYLEKIFGDLTDHQKPYPSVFEYQGRKLELKRTYGGVVFCTFDELCRATLSAADYLIIAKRFHTVMLSGIPVLTPQMRNEARRFINLIDTIYDHRVKLICSAAALPDKLYPKGDGSFEFQRTASRLVELQSVQYLGAAYRHIPVIETSTHGRT